ncbi:MAG: hypothetical protein GY871_17485, partial [Actinomycetales bacterium]|nr:hypothetical protein [Actinomycetales bacterium]
LTFTAGETHALFSGISASVDGDITISTTQAAGSTFGSFPGLQIEGSFPVGPVTHLGTDVQTDMHGINASAYLRIPFEIGGDPQEFTDLTLRMQYDDGFVAYLNGTEIARRNAPTAVGVPPAYDAAASIAHPDEQAVVFEDIDITAHVDKLLSGSNILAIHGLNENAGDNDFLILPELVVARNVAGYLFAPTPGQTNSQISQRVGPLVSNVSHGPARPSGADDLVVTATLTEAPEAVASATLHYRVMFGPESAVPMFDDGTHGDAAAGDGVYGAIVTAADLDAALVASGSPSGTLAGRMVRYYITAADLSGVASRAPAFVKPDDSPEYFGTVAADPSVTTELPVLEWFVQDQPATRTRAGTRASLFYAGEFFDNVFVRIRGRVSTSYPKNSFKFEFNAGNHFRFSPDHPRVDEINVNNTYNDKAYIRPVLAFEALDDAGVASPSAFNMRVNQNAEFHSVAVFVEQVDRDFLRRQDLDPDGALYKFAENASGGVRFAVAEKKTRLDEDFGDLQDLVDGVHPTNANRGEYVFDNLDVAQIVNYMAAMQVIMDVDYTAKNFYMHRDTEGTGLWSIIPWDKDLTFGVPCSIACGSSSDVILADNDATSGQFGPPAAPTHPFFGSVQYSATSSFQAPNHVMDAVINTPATREMYLRRLRTLMDQLLKPTGTPQEELYFENRADELEALLGPDALLDAARWANPWPWGADYDLAQAIDAITDDYLPRRRPHLYQTHSIDNLANYPDSAGIPHAQSGNLQIDFGPIDYNPDSGIQDEEYIQLDNPNGVAVDISGWELTGGVEHTFRPGTVIPAGGSLYVTPDLPTFLARATGPGGGQQLFVQGNYDGHISNLGETIQLVAPDAEVVATVTTPVDPSDAQLYLVVSEIMYHPDEGLAEFIELTNISQTVTLDLTGVKFVDGIDFDFTGSAVTSLAPGTRVLVVRDMAAFTTAHGGGHPVAGVFANATRLSNDGETIKLEDALNSTIKEFTYNDVAPWPTAADAGYSLVLIDPPSNPDPDIAANWRSSTLPGGNPDGTDIVTFPANPLGDDDGNGTADLVDYATGADLGLPALALAVSSETYDIGGSMQTRLTLSYPISLGAEGASIHIDASTDLSTWIDAAPNTEFVSQTNLGDGRAMVTVHFTSPIGDGPQHFLRLRVEQL